VRQKKAKKSSRSIRYLLYADQRLRRISLRRISERLKKAKQRRRSARSKNSVGAKKPGRISWAISARAIVLVAICVVAAAALITAREPSPRSAVARAGAPPDEATAYLKNESEAPVDELVEVRSVKLPAKQLASESTSPAGAADSTAQTDVQNAMPVTITGCLELDDETFWLKDTSGVDAPRSRSWRSGFLKKRPSRIALIDAPNTLRLPGHVGERVTATGTLTNREMRAHSLRRVAASCN
jgi:hypothetical protein